MRFYKNYPTDNACRSRKRFAFLPTLIDNERKDGLRIETYVWLELFLQKEYYSERFGKWFVEGREEIEKQVQ